MKKETRTITTGDFQEKLKEGVWVNTIEAGAHGMTIVGFLKEEGEYLTKISVANIARDSVRARCLDGTYDRPYSITRYNRKTIEIKDRGSELTVFYTRGAQTAEHVTAKELARAFFEDFEAADCLYRVTFLPKE